jgi:hypothetical protein
MEYIGFGVMFVLFVAIIAAFWLLVGRWFPKYPVIGGPSHGSTMRYEVPGFTAVAHTNGKDLLHQYRFTALKAQGRMIEAYVSESLSSQQAIALLPKQLKR